ncbi:MAG: MMPL family transporter [Acidobacteriota bacterium]
MSLAASRSAMERPKTTLASWLLLTAVLVLIALLPSLWPERFSPLHGVRVDTNPENMLQADEPVRIFHRQMKEAFDLHDLVVVGVVNESHPQGVFNAASLGRVWELTEFAKTLRGEAIGQTDPRAGVVEVDLIAPSTVDAIEPIGPGTLRFEWLMAEPPADDAEAAEIRRRAQRVPFLQNTLVSGDGKALGLYLPLTSKELSYQVYRRLQERIASFDGNDQFFVTGLPVAEDTFGVEMFIQMAISAPLAMLVIFLLMWFFFRQLRLIASPLLVAMLAVMCTMALLIASGQVIHIMSSMIPIFVMPIAVLDAVHILSEFFDRYRRDGDRRQILGEVMAGLARPMLSTSLTSAAGFASLALTPIPPVRVFGIFVAIGILLAWLMTITLVPAYILLMPASALERFGAAARSRDRRPLGDSTRVGRAILALGRFAQRRSAAILVATLGLGLLSAWGIQRIEVNDNPIRWFRAAHEIRQSDRVLNEHFAGTYTAYLALTPAEGVAAPPQGAPVAEPVAEPDTEPDIAPGDAPVDATEPSLPAGLGGADTSAGEPELPAGLGGSPEATAEPVAAVATAASDETFKDPTALAYLEDLQQALLGTGIVGKSNSLADIVKTVHRDLHQGQPEELRIPDSAAAVAQTLVQYESSHRPGDLWHFVTPDYRAANLWVQLKSGDNQDMAAVVQAVADHVAAHPPPAGLEAHWFGLTYINVIWQEKMVLGMLKAFLGSFLVILLMMTLFFRSLLWGLLSMIPLTLTIAMVYGLIGWIGKDYDMPVAVLSALALGLAVDFAIHFLTRSRASYQRFGNWRQTSADVFEEPARAIARNVVVIAAGFTPLLLAPLIPYNTVGVLLAMILVISGFATFLVLPAALGTFEGRFFPARETSK